MQANQSGLPAGGAVQHQQRCPGIERAARRAEAASAQSRDRKRSRPVRATATQLWVNALWTELNTAAISQLNSRHKQPQQQLMWTWPSSIHRPPGINSSDAAAAALAAAASVSAVAWSRPRWIRFETKYEKTGKWKLCLVFDCLIP